jgi:hypothetical protein
VVKLQAPAAKRHKVALTAATATMIAVLEFQKTMLLLTHEFLEVQQEWDDLPQPGSRVGRAWRKFMLHRDDDRVLHQTLLQSLLDDRTTHRDFYEHFKCSKETFRWLVDQLGPQLRHKDKAFRPDLVQPAEGIALALHYLTHKGEGTTTAKLFCRGDATVFLWVDKFCLAVKEKFADRVYLPSALDELQDLLQRTLDQRGLPGCWGGALIIYFFEIKLSSADIFFSYWIPCIMCHVYCCSS